MPIRSGRWSFRRRQSQDSSGARAHALCGCRGVFPFDWAFSVRKVMDAVKPAVIVVMETEFGPISCAKPGGARFRWFSPAGAFPTVPSRAFRSGSGSSGFTFARCWPRPFRVPRVPDANGDRRGTSARAWRPAERVKVSGNLKYDQELPAATPLSTGWKRSASSRALAGDCRGSVVANEEPLALIAFGVVQGDYRRRCWCWRRASRSALRCR